MNANYYEENIASLNDRFRRGDRSIKGEMRISLGAQMILMQIGGNSFFDLMQIISDFDCFNKSNVTTRDFGSFAYSGWLFVWKIDILMNSNLDELAGSAPNSGDQVCRILSIMLQCEYKNG